MNVSEIEILEALEVAGDAGLTRVSDKYLAAELETRGLVVITRINFAQLLFKITDAGRVALNETKKEAFIEETHDKGQTETPTLGQIHRTRIAGKESGFAHGEGKSQTWGLGATQLAGIEWGHYWANMQEVEDVDADDELSLKDVFIEGFKDGFGNAIGKYIDLAKATVIADCDSSTLRRAIGRGHLPATKLGGNWVVTYGELKAWIDDPAMHKTGVKAR